MRGSVLISNTEVHIDVDQLRPLAAVPPPWRPPGTGNSIGGPLMLLASVADAAGI
jgi:hypothetical protein